MRAKIVNAFMVRSAMGTERPGGQEGVGIVYMGDKASMRGVTTVSESGGR